MLHTRIVRVGLLAALIGGAGVGAAQEKPRDNPKPPKRDQPARPREQPRAAPRQPAREQPRAAEPQRPRQPVAQPPERRQPQAQRQARPRSPAQQRPPERRRVQPTELRQVWQPYRARSWESEHRDWRQRGGYQGYRIPRERFVSRFGPRHWFRIYRLPVYLYGDQPRFQYGGVWFTLVDPWPEYWSDNWYESDDMYIDYYDDGYYLYNRNHPNARIAVNIYLN